MSIKTLNKKLRNNSMWTRIHFDPFFMFITIILLIYGTVIVWSASGQNVHTMERKLIQVVLGLTTMIVLAQLPSKIYEISAYYLYIICVLLLIVVDVYGQVSKGSQRWLDLGILRFQPSEIAKIVVPLAVTRFVNRDFYELRIQRIFIALIVILIPTVLIAMQPDLGTSILVAISGLIVLFISGINWKLIFIALLLIILLSPIFWFFLMQDYQKERVIMLFNPNSDPLGAGYHIMQSKIAIGSGGVYGKGLLAGSQSQLNFLPERHTDFIFAVLAEELGFIGVGFLFFLYLLLIIRGVMLALRAKNYFGCIIISTFILILFIYIIINVSMVSGILPVVGVPLPMVSYGGSSLIILMASFGIMMSIDNHR
ncbi:rod shape-determining protein RodA [Candidatus Pantoea edessiphila]|uniref:Peptidoglycan glycosyltransferase MrdB n=1 Tax=Candidatus Pantoea edessiphila TaxID=2044610 RepID=A0A2P5SYZ8_9GAMM|nr:rod shape-determining protein RodA [Candidatus Pantoea edessiphila]MBK4775285.1 rod shape-determining protein RodA [Pantoea sp. Edef]PPI87577.1 rod shape-determining protein RodA [Candidatus Pantoea edessiphila]